MTISPGTYELGPDSGTLTVRTGRVGAAARAGHDLLLRVGRWSATLELADDPAQSRVSLSADSRSLSVVEGTGGLKALDDDDRRSIAKTIDDEVLKGTTIAFHSTSVRHDGDGRYRVTGDLELAGATNLIAFEVTIDPDGRLTGSATVRQSDWGMKPYSALFGTLKVADEVVVEIDARLGG
ncbi:MAG TPA: YceI family protein [Solirubrobacteraceae bacterium]|nr:YceI family protein [Solirubrobacteraceae bacterium]